MFFPNRYWQRFILIGLLSSHSIGTLLLFPPLSQPLLAQHPLSLSQQAEIVHQVAQQEKAQKHLQSALTNYQQALDLYRQINNFLKQSVILQEMGDTYLQLNDYPHALRVYQQALAILETAHLTQTPSIGEILWKIARVYEYQQDYEQSLLYYQRSLDSDRRLGNRLAEAVTLTDIATLYARQQQIRDALHHYQQALEIYEQIEDKAGIQLTLRKIQSLSSDTATDFPLNQENDAQILYQQGINQYHQRQFSQALDTFQKLLILSQKTGNEAMEAPTLYNIARVYEKWGKFTQSLDYFNQALTLYRQKKHPDDIARTLYSLGQVQDKIGQYPLALASLQQALTHYRALNNPEMESRTLSNLGVVYHNQGEYAKAREKFEQALTISQEISDLPWEATIYNNLGAVYHSQGEYQSALEIYAKGLTISQKIADRSVEAAVLTGIGNIYLSQKETEQAKDTFEQAQAIYRKLEDKSGEGTVLRHLGSVYLQLGQYNQALQLIEQSLAIHSEAGNNTGKSASIQSLGEFYLAIGQYAQALDYLNQVLDINQEIGNPVAVGRVHHSIGFVYSKVGLDNESLQHYEKALNIQQFADNKGEIGRILSSIALAYYYLGNHSLALSFYERALAIQKEIEHKNTLGRTLNDIGLVYDALGQYSQAIDVLEQALAIESNPADKAISFHNLGGVYYNLQDYAKAEAYLRESIELSEGLRTDLEDLHKISLIEKHKNLYFDLQTTLIAQNKTDEALEIAERGRARAFVDLLTRRLSQKTQSNLSPKAPNIAQIRQIAQQQKATLIQYSHFGEKDLYVWVIKPTGEIIFRTITAEKNLKELIPTTIASIEGAAQIASRSQPQKTDFVLGQFVILNSDSPNSEPWEIVRVDTSNQTLILRLSSFPEGITITRPFSDVIATASSSRQNYAHLQQLHQILIEPIADLLPTDSNAHLVFIPYQELFSVPFAALQDKNGQYLIEKHTIRTAPSIQILTLTQTQRKQTFSTANSLIVGNPTMPSFSFNLGSKPQPLSPLPDAEREAIKISQLLKTTPLTGNEATKAVIRSKMPSANLIHFATHGILDDRSGVNSAIALAPSGDNGLLTASEILDLQLTANLVVLSACKTGLGQITGDGVNGLSRAFIASGVPTVIVSLWNVPDTPTADLMTFFYQNLEKTPDKAQALRQAMLTILQQHPSPQAWAAFTLVGES